MIESILFHIEARLIVQIGVWLTLMWALIVVRRELNRLSRQIEADRAAQIKELKRKADELAERTAEIASNLKEDLKRDAVKHVVHTAEELDAKLKRIMEKFDEIGVQQRDTKQIVDDTAETIDRELVHSDPKPREQTTREQMDDIQRTVEATAEHHQPIVVDRRRQHRDNDTLRTECYAKIRACMNDGISAYYRQFPHLMNDKRSSIAIERSLEGLRCIFNILNEYGLTNGALNGNVKPPVQHDPQVPRVEGNSGGDAQPGDPGDVREIEKKLKNGDAVVKPDDSNRPR